MNTAQPCKNLSIKDQIINKNGKVFITATLLTKLRQ